MPIISNKIKRILIPTARGIFRLFKMPDCSSLAVDDFGSDRWNRLWKDDCVAAVCQARLLPDQLRCHCPNGYSHGSNDCRRGSRPIWNRCDYCRWKVDRQQLAHRVFSDEAGLRWLENLIHPRLFEHWKTAFAAALGRSWVVEVPLLFEKSLQNWFDFTICVASDPHVQLARLEQRGLPPSLARQRISKQLPLTQKIKLVDFVLLNDGSTGFLRAQGRDVG